MQYNDQNQQAYDTNISRASANINYGLRTFMLGVYNNMIIGLAISALSAMAINYLAVIPAPNGARGIVGLTSFGEAIYQSPLKWLLMFAPFIFIFAFNAMSDKLSVSGARLMFFAFAAAMGISLSSILLFYTGNSIVQVFFITAAAFGSLSLWGYTTKKDISGWGAFLMMGVVGLLIAMVVNLFVGSSALQFAISVIGVLVFSGLTAFDTQKLKVMYLHGNFSSETASRVAIYGALTLYMDFINMFMFLLSLIGNRE